MSSLKLFCKMLTWEWHKSQIVLGLVTNGANLIVSECFDVIFDVLFLLSSFKPKFFFANFKFEFYNLIRLSYLIYCCQRTKSWTSSLRKSVLILTRSDFEEVNVVTCWDKKMWFVSLNSCVQMWTKRDQDLWLSISQECDLVSHKS